MAESVHAYLALSGGLAVVYGHVTWRRNRRVAHASPEPTPVGRDPMMLDRTTGVQIRIGVIGGGE